MLEKQGIPLLQDALENLERGFSHLPPFDAAEEIDWNAVREVLLETAERMRDNYPYPHPLYAGQMLKTPHPIAKLAYSLSLWLNPNNHALDGGRASTAMEKEAVAQIAKMFGWKTHLGHLCGGGTMANLEALWVAGQMHPGKAVAASEQAHYTHARICGVLKIPFRKIACDHEGKMRVDALEEMLACGDVGTVVATLGTTAAGAVDSLARIFALRSRYDFRIHVDAAYGGYFILAGNLFAPTRRSFDFVGEADSIAIDPHKHGLQPFGCGCVLFKNPAVGKFYKHESPYTYFTSEELHLGEISLECSRPGSAAVALWATQKLLPLEKGGEFAANLRRSREAALTLYSRLKTDDRFSVAFPPELDIVVWTMRSDSPEKSSALARKVFQTAAQKNLHLATVQLPARFFSDFVKENDDGADVTCLRSCLMKPEHLGWIDEIWRLLDCSAAEVLESESRSGRFSPSEFS